MKESNRNGCIKYCPSISNRISQNNGVVLRNLSIFNHYNVQQALDMNRLCVYMFITVFVVSDPATSKFIDVSDTENVEFEDVLNDIVKDYETVFENKTTLSDQTYDLTENNYNNKTTRNITVKFNDTEKDPFYYIINAIEGNNFLETSTQSGTGIIIDLLKTVENNLSNYSTSSDSPSIDDTFIANSLNVMKREIPILSIDNEVNETDVEVVTEAATNVTDALEQLKDIIIPLNNIIKHKQEVEELKFIKEKLFTFIKNHTEKDFNFNLDINKIMDVFTLLDFSGTTPNTTLLDFIGGRFEDFKNASIFDDVIQNINKCLENNASTEKHLTPPLKDNDVSKNKLTFKKVINMIRETKNDILEIIHAKISEYKRIKEHNKKSEIEKNKKDLTEFEKVVRKWQETLNILPNRNKRSAIKFKDTNNRMKNILPKYLRGKFTPELKQPKKQHTGPVRTEKKNGSKNKNSKHKRRTSKAGIKNTNNSK